MPKSTNRNAPSKEYKNASVDKGAAFRASITFEDALNKLVHATYKGKLENLRGKSSRNLPKPRSAFYSDPWPAYASPKTERNTI
jgi:hypothetical protein